MKISVRNFGEDAGFVYEFPGANGNEARFNIVKCPYYETCKRYGCSELVKAFCDGDDAVTGTCIRVFAGDAQKPSAAAGTAAIFCWNTRSKP